MARNQRRIIKNIRDGAFEYESKEQVLTNGSQYNQAQIIELANYLDNIRDLVDDAYNQIKERTPPKKRGPGRMRSIATGRSICDLRPKPDQRGVYAFSGAPDQLPVAYMIVCPSYVGFKNPMNEIADICIS